MFTTEIMLTYKPTNRCRRNIQHSSLCYDAG